MRHVGPTKIGSAARNRFPRRIYKPLLICDLRRGTDLARGMLTIAVKGDDSVTGFEASNLLTRGRHDRSEVKYESCNSQEELLFALAHAVGVSAADLARALRPLGCGPWSLAVLKAIAPARYESRRQLHRRILSEAIVFIARRLRNFLDSSYSVPDADYVYREAALGAATVVAERGVVPGADTETLSHDLAHVLLQHAHFPPRDDDEALVRLVASRGEKLTLEQAVRFLRKLVDADPLERTRPRAFARYWLSLSAEPAWRRAAVGA